LAREMGEMFIGPSASGESQLQEW